MPRKIKDVTRATLVSVPLPTHADTYTVISHDSIINYAFAELAANGFGVVSEEYRSTLDGQIAQGIYKLQYNSDPEMSLMFAWSNSYNKQMRFKCAVGGYVHSNQTVMISGEMGSYSRKHTGTADQDTIATMSSQIVSAKMYYDQLVLDKEMMKSITLSKRKQAELLGILFAEYEILTTEQASMIRQQMAKPTFIYNGGLDTLWAFYNHVTVALQNSHPRTWMEDQRMLHWFISNEFDLLTPVITLPASDTIVMPSIVADPLEDNYGQPENQTNLLVQIAEIESEQATKVASEMSDAELREKFPHLSDEEFAKINTPVPIEKDPYMIQKAEIDAFSRAQLAGVKAPEDMKSDAFIGFEEDGALMLDAHEEDVKNGEYPDAELETIHYTDPAGNTFEVPVVSEEVTETKVEELLDEVTPVEETVELEVAPARVKFAIDETEVPFLTPTPEEHVMLEAEDATPDDFGFEMDFTTTDDGEDEDDVDHDFFL